MAISQNIVHMMGGEIKVESVYGEGSAFTVTMYLKLQDKNSLSLRIPASLPVLVVDDDVISCETTCQRLEDLGLQGEWVMSGQEAVDQAVKAHRMGRDYFTIIVDLKMPGMDGIETAKQIRNCIGAEIPIILLSSYDWTEYETRARAAGINGFVAKPMMKSSLIYALKRYALKEYQPSGGAKSSHVSNTFEGKKILLVEDNELNREIAAEILSQTGAILEPAANGLEALDKFSVSPPDFYNLIFMDLQMPVMGGIESARRIRSLNREDAKSVAIVAMTANVFAEDVAETKAAGMNDHLAKPFEVDKTEEIMRNIYDF